MKSLKFSERIIINGQQEQVFDYSQDYKNRLLWDVFMKKAELLNGAQCAENGVKAYCLSKNGIGMTTQYVSFKRPKATAVKMVKGPFMFKSFLGSWNFKKKSDSQTEVIFLYSFTLRFPFIFFGKLVKNNLQVNTQKQLANLKLILENKLHNK